MNKKTIVVLAMAVGVAVGAFAFTTTVGNVEAIQAIAAQGNDADLGVDLNVYVTAKDQYGNVKMYDEGHNLLTNAGKEHIEGYLGAQFVGEPTVDYIAVGNGAEPLAASTTLDTEVASDGLERAQATCASTGTGAWRCEKVFSVTGTVTSVNSTGLFNATSGGTLFAAKTFANTNVADGDSLNITWTLDATGT